MAGYSSRSRWRCEPRRSSRRNARLRHIASRATREPPEPRPTRPISRSLRPGRVLVSGSSSRAYRKSSRRRAGASPRPQVGMNLAERTSRVGQPIELPGVVPAVRPRKARLRRPVRHRAASGRACRRLQRVGQRHPDVLPARGPGHPRRWGRERELSGFLVEQGLLAGTEEYVEKMHGLERESPEETRPTAGWRPASSNCSTETTDCTGGKPRRTSSRRGDAPVVTI